jgi:hypothetical protein
MICSSKSIQESTIKLIGNRQRHNTRADRRSKWILEQKQVETEQIRLNEKRNRKWIEDEPNVWKQNQWRRALKLEQLTISLRTHQSQLN